MDRLRKLSLSSAPFYMSLVVIVTLGLFIGSFWAYNEYEAYRQSVANIRDNYLKQYKKRLQEEALNVVDFISYKRSQQGSSIELEIRDKVQSAYSVAAHVYSLYKEQRTVDELRQMVVELLRPIRWDNGLGYYFAGRVSTGVIDLLADKPQFEGLSLLRHEDKQVRDAAASIIEIIEKKGAGQLIYQWSKPESTGRTYPKITFVKHFPPFDWFIGTGIYTDEMQLRIQGDILARIEQIHFGEHGEVLVFRYNGTILSSPRRVLEGRSVTMLAGDKGGAYGGDMLAMAKNGQKGNGFFTYFQKERNEKTPSVRLGFVQSYDDWQWGIATSISMVEMEEAIAAETATYKSIAFKNTSLFIVLFVLAVSILLMVSYFYSMNIKRGIEHFNEFFRRAVDSKARVEVKALGFKEFTILGEYANRMNADRLAKDQVIKRDERRLDTLLQLGLMAGYNLNEIYDFILPRVARIVESSAAYIVTIENAKPILQSQVIFDGRKYILVKTDAGSWVQHDLDLQKVLHSRQILFKKKCNISAKNTLFASDEKIEQRLDVPIVEHGRVVAVLGVCNKKGGYSEDDKRQIMLLLEGMWLHVSKMVGRKEMVRLRQLLKDITDSMPSMLIGINNKFTVMQWNRLAEKRLGIGESAALNRSLMDVLPRMQKHEEQIQRVISDGNQTELRRVPVENGDGVRYESITIYPLKYGERQGAVLRFDDVTEWVAMEEMMIQSEKMLSVGGLAAGIAHEINNPLASVTQSLQVIKKRLTPDLRQNRDAAAGLGITLEDIGRYLEKRGVKQLLEIIGHDSARAAKLVHNMLSFSRKSASAFTSCDVRKLLDKALELGLADYDLKKNYDFRQICISKEYDEQVASVYCEETNIQQVFLNIIRNAAHAIAENRDNMETPELTLRVKNDGDMVRIEIEDNGPGIDSDTSKKIFEPFFTTKETGKGTGLGLSISYFIVSDQHQGSIKLRSQPGKGSAFIVRLPTSPRKID